MKNTGESGAQAITLELAEVLGAHRFDSVNTLLQREAYAHALEVLRPLHDKAHRAKSLAGEGGSGEHHLPSRDHQIIFVNGPRGAGKTTFLLNLPTYLADHKPELAKNLKVLEPIDPALVDGKDHFISTLLAHVMCVVDERLNSLPQAGRSSREREELEDGYRNACQDALDSMEALLDQYHGDDMARGAAMVALKRAGMELERHFHQLFKHACRIFGCDALILPIDDIDMVPERGYEVLETLRKYLVSPFVIPIVSGDYHVYQQIVSCHFTKALYGKRHAEEAGVQGDKFASAYLDKLFPHPCRIDLRNINDLLTEEDVEFSLPINGRSVSLKYRRFADTVRSLVLNGLAHHRAQGFSLHFATARDFFYVMTECRDAIHFVAKLLDEKFDGNKDYRSVYREFLLTSKIGRWQRGNRKSSEEQLTEIQRKEEQRKEDQRHKNIRHHIACDRAMLRNNDFSNRHALLAALHTLQKLSFSGLATTHHGEVINTDEPLDLDVLAGQALVKLLICIVSTDPADRLSYLSPLRILWFVWSLIEEPDFSVTQLRILMDLREDAACAAFPYEYAYGNRYQAWRHSPEYEALTRLDGFTQALEQKIEQSVAGIAAWRSQWQDHFPVSTSVKTTAILEEFLREPPLHLGSDLTTYLEAVQIRLRYALQSVEGVTPSGQIRGKDSVPDNPALLGLFPDSTHNDGGNLLAILVERFQAHGDDKEYFKVYSNADVDLFVQKLDNIWEHFRARGGASPGRMVVGDFAEELKAQIEWGNNHGLFASKASREAVFQHASKQTSFHEALKSLVAGGDQPHSVLLQLCRLLGTKWEDLKLLKAPESSSDAVNPLPPDNQLEQSQVDRKRA